MKTRIQRKRAFETIASADDDASDDEVSQDPLTEEEPGDEESYPDVEAYQEEPDDDAQDDDGEDEAQEDELSASSHTSSPPPTLPRKHPRLKITLKLPGMGASSMNATPTPSELAQPSSRRGLSRDVESEDSMDEDASTRSTSLAGPSRMTHRQAALAGVVEPSEHVSLEEPISKRKKTLNETELALRREETARKRKNLSEKKLEDEKVETINRLLKKQSRSRAKKSALATADPDEEAEADGEEAVYVAPAPDVPTLFRWVSSSKAGVPILSLSVPVYVTTEYPVPEAETPPQPKAAAICDFAGCSHPRKYKLVSDQTKGGCGMEHLKALQGLAKGSSMS